MSIYAVVNAGHGLIPGDLLFGGEYFLSDNDGRQFRFQVYDEYGGDKGRVFLPSDWVRANVRLSLHEPDRDRTERERALVEALRKRRSQDAPPQHLGAEPRRNDREILELMNEIALHLFFARTRHDEDIGRAFTTFQSDLEKLYLEYRLHKSELLGPDQTHGGSEEDVESRYRRAFGSSVLKDRYSRDRNPQLKVGTRAVDLGSGGRGLWLAALASLTALRKMLRGDQLSQVGHFASGGMHHVFTRLDWRGAPTGLWVHNTKADDGRGATRIISFVKGIQVDLEIGHEQIQRDEESLQILDLSYDDVTTLLLAVRDEVFGGSDGNLARYVISLVEGGQYVSFDRPVRRGVLVKPLKPGRGRQKPPTVEVEMPTRMVCLNLLAILFLTEPRHAMTCWVGNLDALSCVARGLINFDQLLCYKVMFPLGSEAPFYDLAHGDVTHPIGTLLPSNNTPKFLLPPELLHGRRLKEMLMPTYELLFKHGTSLDDFVRLLPILEQKFWEECAVNEPWFIEALDYEEAYDSKWDEWISFKRDKNKERRKIIKPLKDALPPNKENARGALTMARKLTFAAPIVKTLLMRRLLLSLES